MSGLLRSNLIVAAGTALSRVTGLLRVVVFVYVIGQTALADAYALANETPNIVYDLLLGGVLSATLVPLFTSLLGIAGDRDRDRAERTSTDDPSPDERAINVVITTAAVLMIGLTVVAVAAAPLIFRVYSIQVSADVDAEVFRDVGTILTRIFLIQILFYGLTGLANAYLNARRRFLAAAWSPILPNLVIIATLLSLPGAGTTEWTLADIADSTRLRLTLGLGATLGIASMALIVVPAAFRAGLRYRPAWDWHHPAVRRLLALSGWTVGFVAANQVALIVVRNLALAQGEGIARAYFDAFTFFVLPHGLLAVSIATTFQPEMARAVTQRDRAGFIRDSMLGVRLIALLTVPAAIGLIVLRDPIIGLMRRGQFDAVDAANTAEVLAGLSIGLVGFSVYLFVLRGFYAHQDTRTPFILNVGENLLNIVLAVAFVRWFGIFGLGLAYAVAYLVAAVWALVVLRNKVRGLSLEPLRSTAWRAAVAGSAMGAALWLMTDGVGPDVGWRAVTQVAVAGAAGLLVYLAVLIALRTPELDAARSMRPGRRNSAPAGPTKGAR